MRGGTHALAACMRISMNASITAKTRTVFCPSGLTVVVRGFKAKEANIFADTAAARKLSTFDQVLRACCTDVVDPGPYTTPLNWESVLIADRFAVVLGIRIATYGPEYAFGVQCPDAGCRERFDWELNLETDLTQKDFPADSIEVFQTSNRFRTTMPDGRAVWFKLMTGADEVRAAKKIKTSRDRLITCALAARIIEIEGVEGNDKMRFLEDLDMQTVRELMDAFDEVDGGFQTRIEVECPGCGNIFDVDLPFGRDFYIPRTRRSRRD